MGSSRSPGDTSLLLCCCLVAGGVGLAAVVGGSGWAAVPGQTNTTTDVGIEGVTQELDAADPTAVEHFDPTPSEDAQTTATTVAATAEATERADETPERDDSDDSDDNYDGLDGSDGTNESDADAESRDPSDFEEAAKGDGTDDPDDHDSTDESDVESRDDAPAVEARSRRRMPTRGPERGTIIVSFDDVPVSTISFTRRQYGNVTVEALDGLPPGVEAPAGDRLSTLRISVPDEIRDSPAKVMFTVDVATLEARGIPDDAVWLAHHDPETGTWDRLETDVVHASDERVVYAASTPGFSLFAIQGDGSRFRSPNPTARTNDTGATDGTVADQAEATFVGGFRPSMGHLLVMGAVSVVTTVYGARRVTGVEVERRNDS